MKMPMHADSLSGSTATKKPAQVWMYQLVVHHYRLPVWDRVVELGGDDYRLCVRGPLKDEQTAPASSDKPVNRRDLVAESAVEVDGSRRREYMRNTRSHYFKLAGIQFAKWPAAVEDITRDRPDLVIVNGNIRNLSSWRLPLLCRKLGIGIADWSKVHAHSYSTTPPFLTRPIKRRFFRRFDVHIVYGQSSRDELIRLGVSPEFIHVAQNTLDTRDIFASPEKIASRALELKKLAGVADRRTIVCVGSMVSFKRQLDLVDAWPKLRAGHDDLVLVLVGGGPMLDEVRQRAGKVDSERIVVTGRVGEGDDHAWLAASDVAVVPGGAGLAINASLALEKPTVIADEFGSDAEIVRHDVTGWRYPTGDLEEMTRRIHVALAGGEHVRKVCQAGSRLMRDKVTLENMARAIDAAIRQALAINRERNRRA